jgi:hypothetical protein
MNENAKIKAKTTNLFFEPDTFNKLSAIETELYRKDWTETYGLLLNELKLRK